MRDYIKTINELPPLRDVIADYNLRAKKSLGQNFLLDLNITDKIALIPGDLSEHTVFEIGSGPGGLTRSILKTKAEKVIAIEFDERAVKALQSLQSAFPNRLEIIHADALRTELQDKAPAPKAIIANLPYNIATPLLVGWLRDIHKSLQSDAPAYSSMTLMFQKEVAQRITAKPNTKAYGRLSILSQWLCDCRIAYDLPPQAFSPPPKVSSSIVHFTPKKPDEKQPAFETVEKITGLAFRQRRKMIRSSLKEYKKHFESLGLDETIRAENISVQSFIQMAHLL